MPDNQRAAFVDERNVVVARPGALPRVRFAAAAIAPPRDSLVALLYLPPREGARAIGARAATLGDGTIAWLLGDPPRHGAVHVPDPRSFSPESSPGADEGVEIVDERPARVTLRLRSSGPRLVATTMTDDGGWTAIANGRRVPVTRINGAFVGVAVPATTSTLELRYRPVGMRAGFAIALGALAAGLSLLLVRRRESRDPLRGQEVEHDA